MPVFLWYSLPALILSGLFYFFQGPFNVFYKNINIRTLRVAYPVFSQR